MGKVGCMGGGEAGVSVQLGSSQSATTKVEVFKSELNCSSEVIWTRDDIVGVVVALSVVERGGRKWT